MKTYKIITYGCQMNKSDSERIAGVLETTGYKKAIDRQIPDILVFNACSVRQSAIDRIYGQANLIRKLKTKNYKLKTIITGCVLPKDRQKFKKIFDLVFNIKDLKRLPVFLRYLERGKQIIVENSLKNENISYFKIRPRQENRFSARIPISFGCGRFCSYCAVPYTRGLEINRPAKDILKEAKAFVTAGAKEIWLLGQTVSSWKDPQNKNYEFTDLLQAVEKIPGEFWVRFESSYVLDFDDKLINFLAKAKKVSNYVNLPLQSATNRVLKAMNRRYTLEQYLKVLEKMKERIPDFSFSTDIIVGFPGETEKQFRNTYNIFKRIKPTMAYIAKYSPRPGTMAEKLFKDRILPSQKQSRFTKLDKLLKQTAKENMAREVGKTLKVLVEEWLSTKKECLGKTRNFKAIRFPSAENLVGRFVRVTIVKAREFEIEGVMAN